MFHCSQDNVRKPLFARSVNMNTRFLLSLPWIENSISTLIFRGIVTIYFLLLEGILNIFCIWFANAFKAVVKWIFSRVLPILTWIAKFVVRVFALTFREGFLSARALTKYKLYCTIHKILDGFDINKEEIGYEWWKVLQNDVFVWCISIYTFNYIFLVN